MKCWSKRLTDPACSTNECMCPADLSKSTSSTSRSCLIYDYLAVFGEEIDCLLC